MLFQAPPISSGTRRRACRLPSPWRDEDARGSKRSLTRRAVILLHRHRRCRSDVQRSKPPPDPRHLEAFHRIVTAGHAVEATRTVAIEDSRWDWCRLTLPGSASSP